MGSYSSITVKIIGTRMDLDLKMSTEVLLHYMSINNTNDRHSLK